MLKTSLYYAVGGVAIVGGPAIGYDLMRRGRLASAEDMHRRMAQSERRALQEGIKLQKVSAEAERVGVDVVAVRRNLHELHDRAGTCSPSESWPRSR